MPPIGDTLREARMRQRLDIVDVEQRTKIRAKYLRALENEEWGLLPGPTFVRTFLRTYAEAVGLDPHALVDEYRATDESAAPEPEPNQPAPLAARGPRRPRRQPRPDMGRARRPGPPGPLVLVGGAVVLFLVFLIALGLLSGDDKSDGDKAAQTDTSARTTARKPARPKRRAPAVPASVTLRIAPTVPTYVCMDSGDGTGRVFEGILSEARTFKNASELRANLGKRSVKLTANGKAFPIADSGDPYGLRVTKSGPSEITDGTRPCG